MGLLNWIFGGKPGDKDPFRPGPGPAPEPVHRASGRKDLAELARRLGMTTGELAAVPVAYRAVQIPKRSGGTRTLHVPDGPLKAVQRRILRKLLGHLRAHDSAHGFERGRSIVTNARPHVGAAVVVRMDIKDFFPTTSEKRVRAYFGALGWEKGAVDALTRLCTHKDGLPQGAPTSPRLSNLVNWELDTRLAALAEKYVATYTRYADDLTFSAPSDDSEQVHSLVGNAKVIVEDVGYVLHMKKKLTIRRDYQQQMVTGLVVNSQVALPRVTRRWLRAVDHYAKVGKTPTLSEAQRAGWGAYCRMITADSSPASGNG